ISMARSVPSGGSATGLSAPDTGAGPLPVISHPTPKFRPRHLQRVSSARASSVIGTLSFPMISDGVFLGALRPTHWLASKPGTKWATVGMLTSDGTGVVTAETSGTTLHALQRRPSSLANTSWPPTACTHKRGHWPNVRSWGEPDTPG